MYEISVGRLYYVYLLRGKRLQTLEVCIQILARSSLYFIQGRFLWNFIKPPKVISLYLQSWHCWNNYIFVFIFTQVLNCFFCGLENHSVAGMANLPDFWIFINKQIKIISNENKFIDFPIVFQFLKQQIYNFLSFVIINSHQES